LLDESIALSEALKIVRETKRKIKAVDILLPPSTLRSFRERIIEQIERLDKPSNHGTADSELYLRATDLLKFFDERFGVNDFLEFPNPH
jgi:hypothetical protein